MLMQAPAGAVAVLVEAQPLLPSDVPRHGLSVAAISAFSDANAGCVCEPTPEELADAASRGMPLPVPLLFEELTTAQVVQRVVKPATAAARCSYAEQLLAQARRVGQARGARACPDARVRRMQLGSASGVAPATVFLSHAWSYRFADLLAAVQTLARRAGGSTAHDVFVWNGTSLRFSPRSRVLPRRRNAPDIFVVNQHDTQTKDSSWYSSAFADAIGSIGCTVLVLQPWDGPVPLQRSWCLWEILSTLNAGCELQLVFPPAQEAAFSAALQDRFDDIACAISRIDTRTADAFMPADKAMIDAAVNASQGGFLRVNARIHERLRSWLAQRGRAALAALTEKGEDGSVSTLQLRGNVGALLLSAGELDEAEPLLRDVAVCLKATLGPAHLDSLHAQLALCRCLHQKVARHRWQHQSDEGEHSALMEQASATIGHLAEAKAGMPEAQHGVLHAIMFSILMLAIGFEEWYERKKGDEGGRPDVAPLLHEMLSQAVRKHGEAHPEALTARFHLAEYQVACGDLAAAEENLTTVVERRRAVLGARHADTVAALERLGDVLTRRNKCLQALTVLAEVLQVRRELLGDTHQSMRATLRTIMGLFGRVLELFKSKTDPAAKGMVLSIIALTKEVLEAQLAGIVQVHGEGAPQGQPVRRLIEEMHKYSLALEAQKEAKECGCACVIS